MNTMIKQKAEKIFRIILYCNKGKEVFAFFK